MFLTKILEARWTKEVISLVERAWVALQQMLTELTLARRAVLPGHRQLWAMMPPASIISICHGFPSTELPLFLFISHRIFAVANSRVKERDDSGSYSSMNNSVRLFLIIYSFYY
jgi:hypothetical protein